MDLDATDNDSKSNCIDSLRLVGQLLKPCDSFLETD